MNTGDAAGDTYISIEGFSGTNFNDILIGDINNNTLAGLAGADVLDGGGGFDFASYDTGGLTAVRASLTNPAINIGDAIGDTYTSIEGLIGTAFNDILIGDGNNNVLRGQGGNDTLEGLNGNDTIDGGSGIDTASYENSTLGVVVSLGLQGSSQNTGGAGSDTLSTVENLTGSTHNDVLTGDFLETMFLLVLLDKTPFCSSKARAPTSLPTSARLTI